MMADSADRGSASAVDVDATSCDDEVNSLFHVEAALPSVACEASAMTRDVAARGTGIASSLCTASSSLLCACPKVLLSVPPLPLRPRMNDGNDVE